MTSPFDSEKYLASIATLLMAEEGACVHALIPSATLREPLLSRVQARARRWVEAIRHDHRADAGIANLLTRFGLSSHEGLALMCLAEALLRIPDRATADALIQDKLSETEWASAMSGPNTPWVVNAAGWALAVTGKVLDLNSPLAEGPGAVLGRLVARAGQPVIREAIRAAMQWMANQFVTGETITEALANTKDAMQSGIRFSFDMLGEGARTAEDAERYYNDYLTAIEAVGEWQRQHGFERASGISVKLSALHPRYEIAQRDRVMAEMLPRVIKLCEKAASYDIPLTIDAEEVDRLHLSLDLAAALFERTTLASWQGLGFAVQAYQKRAPKVIAFFVALAKHHKRKIHLRLVKGAYWDTEVKRAQERGFDEFPVFTRKASTDISYLACARLLLAETEWINPVFGSHNALTIASVVEQAGMGSKIEFQRLHGMGQELHKLVQDEGYGCCVYAPVGRHDVLLGYLVRRILENGANSSFVHQLHDPNVPVDTMLRDPVEQVLGEVSVAHPRVIRAPDLFRPSRRNSAGLDLADPYTTAPMLAAIAEPPDMRIPAPLTNIADIYACANAAYAIWSRQGVEARAVCLDALADLLEGKRDNLLALLVHEAKKTIPDALAEVREAVDFCRYYAAEARTTLAPRTLPGPTGEVNTLQCVGRGVFVCISPWNFPLAIFLGQVAAALVAGNAVIAKPAPQTPAIAFFVHALFEDAGFTKDILQIVPGGADVGAALVAQRDVAGVAFTGSTTAAQAINRALAAKDGPIVPLIAETGGQNAMIIDSTALPEQVVDDVITSAFRSAGQRCSALRILCLPHSTADKIIHLIAGAMAELRVGNPALLSTDVGPVIDGVAAQRLRDHGARLKAEAKELYTLPLSAECAGDNFIAPQMWEIPSIPWLKGEVFGPILHIVRYKDGAFADVVNAINATGFGLTGGIHSRINKHVEEVGGSLNVGNFYINRSLIGAVVGVQPFGGQGLSGTGPKAGGPHYLYRFVTERVTSHNTTAAGGNATLIAAMAEG